MSRPDSCVNTSSKGPCGDKHLTLIFSQLLGVPGAPAWASTYCLAYHITFWMQWLLSRLIYCYSLGMVTTVVEWPNECPSFHSKDLHRDSGGSLALLQGESLWSPCCSDIMNNSWKYSLSAKARAINNETKQEMRDFHNLDTLPMCYKLVIQAKIPLLCMLGVIQLQKTLRFWNTTLGSLFSLCLFFSVRKMVFQFS